MTPIYGSHAVGTGRAAHGGRHRPQSTLRRHSTRDGSLHSAWLVQYAIPASTLFQRHSARPRVGGSAATSPRHEANAGALRAESWTPMDRRYWPAQLLAGVLRGEGGQDLCSAHPAWEYGY